MATTGPGKADSAGKAGPEMAIDPAVILHPNDLSAVPGLLEKIQNHGTAALSQLQDDESRLSLLQSARALVRALEKPRETMIRHCWGDNTAFAILSTGVEIGLWAHLGKDDTPKSVAEIAATAGIEEALLARLLKHVAAMGYIQETGRDEYRPSNFIKALAIPIIGHGYPALYASVPHSHS